MKCQVSIAWLIAVLAIAMPHGEGRAQERPLHFEHYRVEPGLPGQGMTDILEDRHGFLWFGGFYGLARFDGYSFEEYPADDSIRADAPKNLIWALAETPDGAIWAGHTTGLARRDPVTGVFTRIRHDPSDPASLSDDWVSALSVDADGILWAGTWNGGLNRVIDRGSEPSGSGQSGSSSGEGDGSARFRFVRYEHDPADEKTLGSNRIQSLHESADGSLWIGTDVGLDRLDAERQVIDRVIDHAPEWVDPDYALLGGGLEFPPHGVREIVDASDGALWLATGDGLVLYDPGSGVSTRYVWRADVNAEDRSPYWVHALAVDRDSSLWVGTKYGLRHFSPEKGWLSLYTEPGGQEFPQTVVLSLTIDGGGNLWIGTTGWLSRANPHRGRASSIVFNPVGIPARLSAGADGRLLVGTTLGRVYRVDGETGAVEEVILPPEAAYALRGLSMSAVAEDPDGFLWVGTATEGLLRVNLRTGATRSYRHDPQDATSPASDGIRNIHRDRLGNLWITTTAGLDRWQATEETFLRYAPDSPEGFALPARAIQRVFDMGEEQVSVEWDGGAALVDMESSRILSIWTPPPLETDPAIEAFRRHEPWYPTRDREHNQTIGPPWNRPLRESLRDLTGAMGPFPCRVTDDDGVVWIASRAGVIRFDPHTGSIQVLGEERGFDKDDFNRGNFCGRDEAGFVYFARFDGLYRVWPPDFRELDPTPATVITSIQVHTEVLSPGLDARLPLPPAEVENVTLRPDENDLTFSFVGVDYANAGRLEYSIRLDGYETEWRSVGADRSARYTNLSPGDYRFLARALGPSGQLGPEASLSLSIGTPWWRTWWALSSFALLFGLTLAWGVGRRTRQLRSRAAELVQAVDERTRELVEARAESDRQAVRLAELDRAKSHFFANISHEFRTPLTLVLGPLQDALEGKEGGRPREQEVPMMHRNARRLLQLVNQLLDLSKLEAGQLHLTARRTDLAGFVRGMVESFSSRAERSRIDLRFEDDSGGLEIWADHDKLEKIVGNLVSNAIKFTPEGGRIAVRVTAPEDGTALIAVSDTGPGIAAEHLPFVFDRFYQADAAATRTYEGTGIGLALVRELVELHGGRIDAESDPGAGARFLVCLPLGRDHLAAGDFAESGEGPAAGATTQFSGKATEAQRGEGARGDERRTDSEPGEEAPTILIVEDNADMRTYLSSQLADRYTVHTAVDGQDGLDRARRLRPDLVITDVMMPRMDGFEFSRILREDPDLGHIPIVMLTARIDPESKMDGLASGVDDYLPKPFSASELRARVRNLLATRSILRTRFGREVIVQPADIVITPEEEIFLMRVLEIMNDHLGNPSFSVEWLADEIGISRRPLERRVEAATGETPAALIRRLRVERAAQLLRARAGTVAEIAHMVGFRSPSHFSRVFLRETGTTPSEARSEPEVDSA